jgi:hypothetical protein
LNRNAEQKTVDIYQHSDKRQDLEAPADLNNLSVKSSILMHLLGLERGRKAGHLPGLTEPLTAEVSLIEHFELSSRIGSTETAHQIKL